jgi:shikimate dehydrogenase
VISGATVVVGIVGHPVAHSRSPALQNAAFAALGLDWVYVAFDVLPPHLATAIAGARALGLRGLNVTAPHKAAAVSAADRLVGAAAELELVNTLVFSPEGVRGHSTDGVGFLAAAADHGLAAGPGLRAVVLGAGGAGLSVAHALLGEGAEVTLVNRDPARLREGAARLTRIFPGAAARFRPIPLGDARLGPVLATADLLVGTIPASAGVPPELDLGALAGGAVVADLGYSPAVPPLLAAAEGRGHRTWNGLGMLVHQGALSFSLWTGRPAPLSAMALAAGYELPETGPPPMTA